MKKHLLTEKQTDDIEFLYGLWSFVDANIEVHELFIVSENTTCFIFDPVCGGA